LALRSKKRPLDGRRHRDNDHDREGVQGVSEPKPGKGSDDRIRVRR